MPGTPEKPMGASLPPSSSLQEVMNLSSRLSQNGAVIDYQKQGKIPIEQWSQDILEDYILRLLKKLIQGHFDRVQAQQLIKVIYLLGTENSSKKQLFEKSLRELAAKANFNLDEEKDY